MDVITLSYSTAHEAAESVWDSNSSKATSKANSTHAIVLRHPIKFSLNKELMPDYICCCENPSFSNCTSNLPQRLRQYDQSENQKKNA
jgi:hypothetical protein